MDKNMNFTGFVPYDMNFDTDINDMYKDSIFNPMLQYEQGFIYYRYLCMQMDYKIRCKEYEKMCNFSNKTESRERKIE